MTKRRLATISVVLLVLLAAMFVPYRTASAAPAISSATAVPNMASLFGDNKNQTRNSPFGPGWFGIVVNATGATSVTAKLGDFIWNATDAAVTPNPVYTRMIMPANARTRALSTTNWDAKLTTFNNTALSETSGGSGVWKTVVNLEDLLAEMLPKFTTLDARRIVENELQTGQKTITVSATDGATTTTSTVTVWVVDAQIMLHQGWNLRSTPMALADSTWSAIVALGNKTSIISAGLKFNAQTGSWQVLGTTDTVGSLDGVYIYSTQNDAIGARLFRSTTGVAVPASKNLYRGAWNLIGTAPDFALDNFATVTNNYMRGTQPITTALASLGMNWVTAVSPGEADDSITQTYSNSSVTLGTYTWRFGVPGWTFTSGIDAVVAWSNLAGATNRGQTLPFGGYWVFVPTDSGGVTTPVVLNGKNQGVLTDSWLGTLVTNLGP